MPSFARAMTDHGETTLLRVHGLATTIAEGRRVELSFVLERGQVLQLGGPSGCGKTTALRMLSRLTAASQGEMSLEGVASTQIPAPAWRRRLAYLAQQPVMLEGSVRQNLLAAFDTSNAPGPAPAVSGRPRQLLEDLGLDADEQLDQDARVLSGGEAARVALARTLLMEPAVLLADEPTATLDPDNAAALVRVITGWLGQGGALVLVAHDVGPWDEVERQVLEIGTGKENG